jgi:hypothetical protein
LIETVTWNQSSQDLQRMLSANCINKAKAKDDCL